MEPESYKSYNYHHLNLPLRRDILHRAVIWEGDATRRGTASAKHRTEVRGSSRKVRPQKGTGRARLSDARAPHIRGGGVVHGPHPRDFSTELPAKIYDLAYRTALSYRYKKGELIVLKDSAGLGLDLGPRWLHNFFEAHSWGKGNGRTLIVAKEPEDGALPNEKDHLMEAMEQVGMHGELQWMQDVDVKDLLSYGRIVIEEEALNELLSSQTSFRDNFLVSRAAALLPKRKIEKPANPGAPRGIGELETEEDIEELEGPVDVPESGEPVRRSAL